MKGTIDMERNRKTTQAVRESKAEKSRAPAWFSAMQLDLRVALMYVIFGGLWILLSDRLLAASTKNASALTAWQTYKGWAFVAASALVIFLLLRRELTFRKIAEGKLEESEERHRQLFDHSLDAILLTAPDGSIYAANPAACRMFGRTEAEIQRLGRNGVLDVADPRLKLALEERARTRIFHGELTLLRADGTRFEGEVSANIFENAKGDQRTSMIIRDVTERKQMENELIASRDHLANILNSITDAFITLDRDWRITYINPEAARINKKRPEEFIGKTHWEEWPASVGTIVESNYRKAMDEGVAVHFEHRYFVEGQYDVWLDIHAYPTDDGLVIYYHDITERKTTESALLESEERLKFSQRIAHVGHWTWDTRENRVTWSDEMKRIFGLDPDTFDGDLGKVIALAIHPDDREKVNASNASVTAEGKPIPLEYRVIRPDQSVRMVWAEAGEKITDENGNVIKLSGIVQDITERKRAEETLRQAEKKYRTIFDNAMEGIHQTTRDGKYITVNPAAARILGYDSPEELMSSVSDLNKQFYVAPGRREEFIKLMDARGMVLGFESEVYCKDGSRVWVSENVYAVRDELGTLLYYEGTTENIAERKLAEKTLRESEDRYRDLVENIHDLIGTHDLQGNILSINPVASHLLGIDHETLLRMNLRDLLMPDVRGQFDDYLAAIQKDGQAGGIMLVQTAGGDQRIWEYDNTLRTDSLEQPIVRALARDVTERKQAEEKIRRQVDYLTALREIDRTIASTFDMRLSLNSLLSQTVLRLAVDAAAILLVNSTLNTLEYAAGRGFRTDTVKTADIQLGEGYAGRVALERRLIQIPNFAEKTDNPLLGAFLKEEEFVSYHGAPLIVKGKVVGVLEVFHRSVVGRDAEWLDFFNTLAGQAAIAIDNARLFEDMQHSNSELILAYDATIEGWSRAMDLRDEETEGHTQRVTELTLKLAVAMGMRQEDIMHIRRGALLHDIGKLGVPDSILLKPDKLTDEEWAIMRQHPTFAYEMLLPIRYLRPALDIPYCHHEKWDGTGYPRGLKGGQIPLSARIFSVVDVWDALRSDRPYRPAWTREKTLEHIRSLAGVHFDPQVVTFFLKMCGDDKI